MQCHSLLNYYTVSTYDEIKTDGKSQTTIHHAVILIHACTAEERIDAFGFSPGVKAHVLEMLGVLRQIESETGSGTVKGGNVSATVLAYQSLINQYCTQYGISGYESLVLAVMQQESGGTGKDPMQASECGFNTRFPNVPNGITDPNYSIKCGVEDLAKLSPGGEMQVFKRYFRHQSRSAGLQFWQRLHSMGAAERWLFTSKRHHILPDGSKKSRYVRLRRCKLCQSRSQVL